MTECPGCGGPLEGDEETCPACGASTGVGPEAGAEVVPSVEPEAGNGPEKLCPECGALNPAEARFCVGCGHGFAGKKPFLGAGWLAIPAVIAVILVVAAVAAFSFGFVGAAPKTGPTVNNSSAISGADAAAKQVVNQSRNVTNTTHSNATEVVNATNATGTPTVTPTRTVDPNATPWNAAEGAGIYHDGGTHYVGVSKEIRAHRPTETPLPYSGGDGSGHATGPLSWVGTGNWSPGFIDLPAGDAQVVLLSKGATAFVLADPSGSRVGFGAFLPPGGTYTVPVEAGRYVIAFGTANATDSWSATVLLQGSGGQAAVPPVATPATQVLSFAGTGGGSPGSFNLTPGTVHVQLSASQMTMAYLKDQWGATLSTTVAGPSEGGSTVAITRAGTYRLDVWGTGAWSATVTWTGPTGTTAATLPTVVTPASIISIPPTTQISFGPSVSVTSTPTAAVTAATTVPSQTSLSWSGSGSNVTPFFALQAGVYKISAKTDSGVVITLRDSLGNIAGLYLPVVNEGSEIFHVDDTGSYVLDIQGDEHLWTISISPVPVSAPPTGEAVILTGNGYTGLGPFYLNEGYNTMVISSDSLLTAMLLDNQGMWTEGAVHYQGTGTSTHAFNVPVAGSYFLNVSPIGQDPWSITIKTGQ
ncbi:MAG: zinc ribbon domain-containing protein [Methanospirillum sp.]